MDTILYILVGLLIFVIVPLCKLILPSVIYIFLTRFLYRYKVKSVIIRSLPIFLVIMISTYNYYVSYVLHYEFQFGEYTGVITSIVCTVYFLLSEVSVFGSSIFKIKKNLLQFLLTGITISATVLFIFIRLFPFSYGEVDIPNRKGSECDIWSNQNKFRSIEEVNYYIKENYVNGNDDTYIRNFKWDNYEKSIVEIQFLGEKAYEFSYDEGYISMHMIFLQNGRILKTVWINKSV